MFSYHVFRRPSPATRYVITSYSIHYTKLYDGKKESNWGKRHPVLDGQDCFNYWGYRGQSERIGSGGHTCFDSPRQAVNVVANRINEIIKQNDVQSAKDMIVWKCGFSCDGHSDESVRKWISDVDYYAKKVIN